MFESKTSTSTSLEPNKDPLDGAKTTGDKQSLLEALIIEGKLATSPYQGPTSLMNETKVSAEEILHHAMTGAKTEEVEAAKNLPSDLKIALMERVLEQYPNTSVKEIRATCAVLEIDPERFIKESTDIISKEIEQGIKEIKTSRDYDNVVLNLFYRDSESISLVDSNIEKSLGTNIQDSLSTKYSDLAQTVFLDLALIGQTNDPFLDLQRVQALLIYEQRQQQKTSVPLSTAQEIHLEKMQKSIEKAKDLLDLNDKQPLAISDFYQAIKEAQKAHSDFVASKSWLQKNPQAYRALVVTALLILCLIFLQDNKNIYLYWLSTFLFGYMIFLVGDRRLKANHEKIKNQILNQYYTEAEKRGFKRSQKLRKYLKK